MADFQGWLVDLEMLVQVSAGVSVFSTHSAQMALCLRILCGNVPLLRNSSIKNGKHCSKRATKAWILMFFFCFCTVVPEHTESSSCQPQSADHKQHHLCRILRHQRCQLAQRPPTPTTSQPEASAESLAPCCGHRRHPGNSSAAHVHPPREATHRGAWSILHQSPPLRYFLWPFLTFYLCQYALFQALHFLCIK